jgi:hypothetical protein
MNCLRKGALIVNVNNIVHLIYFDSLKKE